MSIADSEYTFGSDDVCGAAPPTVPPPFPSFPPLYGPFNWALPRFTQTPVPVIVRTSYDWL